MSKKQFSFLFPGQGAQYLGMGKDFYDTYKTAKYTFEEADDLLNRPLSKIIFGNDETLLIATKNSQPAIYVTSIAILRVLQELFSEIKPTFSAGLSLGEYTALTASNKLSFQEGIKIVEARGLRMQEAAEASRGGMSVILGMQDDAVEEMVKNLNFPNDLWCANFNCPGQVVISGTLKGIEEGTKAAYAQGAKKVIPLDVAGAFHSGLMKPAQEKLFPLISELKLQKTDTQVAMNVTGSIVSEPEEIRKLLLLQITSPVRFHVGMKTIDQAGADIYIEVGCGKTVSNMMKRIGVRGEVMNLEKVDDLKTVEQKLNQVLNV